MNNKRYIVGLTGATGSGKSTIAGALRDMGAHVLDTDAITRRLQQPGMPGAKAIRREFGDEYFDDSGELIRPRLAALVFNDAAQLKRLNDIMHPLIMETIDAMLQKLDGVCIIDAPVLFEAGADAICDYIILATADKDIRLQRIMARDGLDEKQARQRMRSQNPNHRCDMEVNTTDGMHGVRLQLAEFMRQASGQTERLGE